jgi:hypothetical protein
MTQKQAFIRKSSFLALFGQKRDPFYLKVVFFDKNQPFFELKPPLFLIFFFISGQKYPVLRTKSPKNSLFLKSKKHMKNALF